METLVKPTKITAMIGSLGSLLLFEVIDGIKQGLMYSISHPFPHISNWLYEDTPAIIILKLSVPVLLLTINVNCLTN